MPAEARILVVEDEGIVAMDIQNSLESLGYKGAEVASTGEEALERAGEITPDLVLMDIRLGGGMDGVETAMVMGESMDVPVVYLTAYTDEQTLEKAKMSQPFGYLVKPFSPKELQTTIEIALSKHAMEKQMRTRERWLSTTLRSIGDAVVACDLDGRILFMNPMAQILTGWSEAEALDRELEVVIPLTDVTGREFAMHPGRLAPDMDWPEPEICEMRLRDRNGRLIPVEGLATPLRMGRNAMDGVVLVLRDIGFRQAGEEQARIKEEEARQAHRLDAMGKLARGVAHDFNNHLSVIMGVSEMLAADLQEEPDRRDMLEEIRKACRNSVSITKQLQAFARRDSFKLKPVDLNASVREVEKIVRKVMGADVTVRTQLTPLLDLIQADETCLEQAIMNLAMNARESMPRGGVLSFTTSQELLEDAGLSYQFPLVPGQYVLLRVGDSGHGIPPEVRPYIFEPFFTTKSKNRGTGLGLATVHGMMKHLGGNILVYSEPGHGSAFLLYFPIPTSPA